MTDVPAIDVLATMQRSMDRLGDRIDRSLVELRKDIRIFGVLLVLGVLALAGVNVATAPNGKLLLTPASASDTMSMP